mmetsp:Transcript_7555/g.19181  ORF Transcript_7555/g.19181 Transcript_7555/m.19181 type:complete len:558 (+) Transcript_7555:47-1720(+)
MDTSVAVKSGDTATPTGDIDIFCHRIRELLAHGNSELALVEAGRQVDRIRDEVDHAAEAKALLMQASAHAACYPEDSYATGELAQSSAEAFRVLGDTDGEWEAMKLLVEAHLEAKCAEGAAHTAEAFVNRCRQQSYQSGVAWGMAALAEAALLDNRTEDARASLNQATKIYRELSDTAGEARCQVIACNLALASDEQDEAHEAALRAHELYDTINDNKGLAQASIRLASAYVASGQHIEALRSTEQALKLAFEEGDKKVSAEAALAEVAAKIAICAPRAVTSTTVSNVSLHILKLANAAVNEVMATRKHDPISVGDAYYLQAQACVLMGSYKNGDLAIKKAAKAYRKARDLRRRAKAVLLWSEIEVNRGYIQDARIEARRAQDFYEQLGDDEGLSKVQLIYDQIDKALGIPTQAELQEQQRQQLLALQMQQNQLPGGMPQNLPVMEQPPEQQQQADKIVSFQRDGGPLILSADVSSAEITSRIVTIVSQILGDDNEEFEVDLPLMEVGISSNKAVILRDELSKDIPGIKLPSTLVFDYPSVSDITAFIADKSGIAAG